MISVCCAWPVIRLASKAKASTSRSESISSCTRRMWSVTSRKSGCIAASIAGQLGVLEAPAHLDQRHDGVAQAQEVAPQL